MSAVPESSLRCLRQFIQSPPQDVAVDAGMSADELSKVEQRHRFTFPPDLRALLSCGLPTSEGFPNWRSGSFEELRAWLDRPARGVCFDIERNGFWYDAWGAQPADLASACAIARERIAAAPTLVPVYAHRFIPDEPSLEGNPVFSVWQTDVIIYGADLCAYLQNEFGTDSHHLESSMSRQPRSIEFWTDLALPRLRGGR